MKKFSYGFSALGAVSAVHFLVDFACIFLITSYLPVSDWLFYALLYNFCAFALQLPLGIWADLRQKQMPFAVLGCVFVALAFFLVLLLPLAGCVLAGVGNGFFHVGGGVTVLRAFPKKAARCRLSERILLPLSTIVLQQTRPNWTRQRLPCWKVVF